MALINKDKIKIFSLNRLKFNELYEDALKYIKATYKAVGQSFNTASPFGQLLQVTLHLGRMIFYYIEDSITGLNIRTAYRPDQVKGLAMLAGHDSSRPISARGACRIYYTDSGNADLTGNICFIPNKTQVVSKLNGATYTLFFGAANAKITMTTGNYIEANLIQGIIKLQQATGTGEPLQSFNFAERNYSEVDQYHIIVYVNGELWEQVKSLIDLGYNQKGCIVRTGINSGLDLFFGNGDMGAIPAKGSSIIVEYIVSDGTQGNLHKTDANASNSWEFEGEGVMQDGTSVKLDGNFKLSLTTDIIFGTMPEDMGLTQLIAPHVSRSYVLANETNYNYFFRRMNMFSEIGIYRGTNSINGTQAIILARDNAKEQYESSKEAYDEAVEFYGANSDAAQYNYTEMQKYLSIYNYTESKLTENTYRDNTVYIYLVPDITKRISTGQNYFNCSEDLFYLSEDEQENIINLLNYSGQRILTIENRIISPKTARFSVNVHAKIWEGYEEEDIYNSGLTALSDYFLNFSRKDIIPVSDIVALFEAIDGVDSVRVSFDADVKNAEVYGESGFYGIDSYGDIVLTRNIIKTTDDPVKDVLPLIRGGFTSPNGVEYSADQSFEAISAYNFQAETTKSSNSTISLTKYTALT